MNLIILKTPILTSKVRKRWLLGESAKGGDIGEYKTNKYKLFKISINSKASGKVDLTLTGALAKGLSIKKASSTSIEFFSKDKKFFSIGNKYGFEEFGLTDEEWIQVGQEVIVLVIKKAINNTYN